MSDEIKIIDQKVEDFKVRFNDLSSFEADDSLLLNPEYQ